MKNRVCLLTTVVFVLCSVINCSVYRDVEITTEASHEIVLEKWKGFLDQLKDISDRVTKMILPIFIRVSSEIDLSADCQGSLLELMLALRKGKLWAIQMVDAIGKPLSGAMAGTVVDYGSYKSCIDINVQKKYGNGFQGMYCLADFRAPMPKKPKHFYLEQIIEPFQNLSSYYQNDALDHLLKYVTEFYFFSARIGLCLPSTCTKQDAQNIISYATKQIGFYGDVPSCEVKTDWSLNKTQLIIMYIFSGFVLLVVLATVFDVSYERWFTSYNSNEQVEDKKPEKGPGLLRAFLLGCSIRRNLKILISTEKKAGNIHFFDGMKVLAMGAIVASHIYSNSEYHALREPHHFSKNLFDVPLQYLVNGRIHVDTFVFISGALYTYLFIKSAGKRKMNILNMILFVGRRIWRLEPMFLVVVGIVLLSPLIGSGPIWNDSIGAIVENCYDNWWHSLIFITNFTPIKKMCIAPSWYIAMDMQLCIIFIIFYFLYLRQRTLGYGFLLALTLTSVIPIAILTYQDSETYAPSVNVKIGDPGQIFSITDLTAIKLYLHLGVFAIGMATGIFISRTPKLTIPLGFRIFAWLFNIFTCCAVLFGNVGWNSGEVKPQPLEAAAYAATFRVAWSVGLAWLTIACRYGYGGYINDFLSWGFFLPFSRINFIVFLVNMPVLQLIGASTYGVVDYRHTILVTQVIMVTVSSVALSIFLYIFFECPIKLVDIMLLNNSKSRIKAKPKTMEKPATNDNSTNF